MPFVARMDSVQTELSKPAHVSPSCRVASLLAALALDIFLFQAIMVDAYLDLGVVTLEG